MELLHSGVCKSRSEVTTASAEKARVGRLGCEFRNGVRGGSIFHDGSPSPILEGPTLANSQGIVDESARIEPVLERFRGDRRQEIRPLKISPLNYLAQDERVRARFVLQSESFALQSRGYGMPSIR
jgi:hypothetical protein